MLNKSCIQAWISPSISQGTKFQSWNYCWNISKKKILYTTRLNTLRISFFTKTEVVTYFGTYTLSVNISCDIIVATLFLILLILYIFRSIFLLMSARVIPTIIIFIFESQFIWMVASKTHSLSVTFLNGIQTLLWHEAFLMEYGVKAQKFSNWSKSKWK